MNKKGIKKYYPGVNGLVYDNSKSVGVLAPQQEDPNKFTTGKFLFPKQETLGKIVDNKVMSKDYLNKAKPSFGDKAKDFFSNPDLGGIASSVGNTLGMMINANKKDPNPGRPYKKGTSNIKRYANGSKGLFDSESGFRKGLDAGLLGASFIPGVGFAANVASSGLNLYDAYNAKTPEARNEALMDAGTSLIPFGKAFKVAKKGFQGAKNFMKAGNVVNKVAPAFEKGTKNINSNNMKMKKYDDGTQGAKSSRYQRLDAKLGGILPGGVTRAEAKAMKASKNASPEGSYGPMAGGYAGATRTTTGVGPLAGGYGYAPVDASKPAGPMTDIKRYMDPDNIPAAATTKTSSAPAKVNFKKPSAKTSSPKKTLGGGYKMYEDMNVDQRRQYREGMASGKDFTVTVADKYGKNRELKYKAATEPAAALSKKRNAEYDKRYQAELIKQMPATKNLEQHDHLLRWQDKALENAQAQFDARHKGKVVPTPAPKPGEEDTDYSGIAKGLGGSAALAGLYYGAKKMLKRAGNAGKIASAGLEVAEEAVPVIRRNAQKLLPAARNTFNTAQQKAQEAFNSLNIKRIGEGTKASVKESAQQAVKGETKQLQKGVRLRDVMPDNSDKIKFKTKETKLLPPASEKSVTKTRGRKKSK